MPYFSSPELAKTTSEPLLTTNGSTNFLDLFGPTPVTPAMNTDSASSNFPVFFDDFSTLSPQTSMGNFSSDLFDNDIQMSFDFDQGSFEVGNGSIDENTAPYTTRSEDQTNVASPRDRALTQHDDFQHIASSAKCTGWSAPVAPMVADSVVDLEPAARDTFARTSSSLDFSLSRPRTDSANTICDCFDNSVSLLRKLTPESLLSSGHPECATDRTLPSFDSVIARNDDALAAVSKAITCRCPHDSALLGLLPIIVFKALGWYAAAASAMPMNTNAAVNPHALSLTFTQLVQLPTGNVVRGDFPGETPEQVASELILSKISSVKRIINQLCTHLQTAAARTHDAKASIGSKSAADVAQELLINGAMPDITGGSIVANLETNLRTRLRDLCECVMASLLEK